MCKLLEVMEKSIKKMFYWFVPVSFNTRTKVKHLGVGVGTFSFACLRGAVASFSSLRLVADHLLQTEHGVAQFFG